jgi:hypothetical protein
VAAAAAVAATAAVAAAPRRGFGAATQSDHENKTVHTLHLQQIVNGANPREKESYRPGAAVSDHPKT